MQFARCHQKRPASLTHCATIKAESTKNCKLQEMRNIDLNHFLGAMMCNKMQINDEVAKKMIVLHGGRVYRTVQENANSGSAIICN